MKKLIAIVFASITLAANAGMINEPRANALKTGYFSTEAAAVDAANDLIPGILNLTDKRVRSFGFAWGCTVNTKHIELRGVNVSKSYAYVDGAMEARYRAIVGYLFTKCEREDN